MGTRRFIFKIFDPEEYYDLVEKVAKKRREREEYISNIIENLKEKLDEDEY